MLKRIPLMFCLAILGLLFNSCKKDKKLTELTIDYDIPFVWVMDPDVAKVDTFIERETYDFATTLEGVLANNNTSKEKIKSAKLVFMRMQVPDLYYNDTANYSNLKDISAIELDIKKDNIGQKLVAKKMIADSRIKAINLDLEDVELKDYLKQDNFRMVCRYKKRRPMPNQMITVISVKFRIIADPL